MFPCNLRISSQLTNDNREKCLNFAFLYSKRWKGILTYFKAFPFSDERIFLLEGAVNMYKGINWGTQYPDVVYDLSQSTISLVV